MSLYYYLGYACGLCYTYNIFILVAGSILFVLGMRLFKQPRP